MLNTPGFVELGMMILSIVSDYNNPIPGNTADILKLDKKFFESLCIETIWFSTENEHTIANANCTIISDPFSGRMMLDNRINDLGWNPHAAARAVLLKMDFIYRPKINIGIGCHHREFFYAPLGAQGQHALISDVAYEAENQVV